MARNKEEITKKRREKVTGGLLKYSTHTVWQQKMTMEVLN
jgi:hypothetical protein